MPNQNAANVLLLVALKTDQPNIERRLRTILAAAEPVQPDTEPVARAKPVDELVAADLDALALICGWDAVARLRVGDVVSGGASYSLVDRVSGDAPDSPDIDSPSRHEGRIRMLLDGPDKGKWFAYCLDCDWTSDDSMPPDAATREAERHEHEADRG